MDTPQDDSSLENSIINSNVKGENNIVKNDEIEKNYREEIKSSRYQTL